MPLSFPASAYIWLTFAFFGSFVLTCGLMLLYKLWQVRQRIVDQQAADLRVLQRELSHRVNTNLAVVIGLMELQLAQVIDPNARSPLQQSLNRVRSVALLQQPFHERNAAVNLRQYVQRLYQTITPYDPADLILTLDTDELSAEIAMPLGLIIHELLADSALHAAPQRPDLTVSLTRRNGLLLEITDRGPSLENQTPRWSRAGVALPQRLIEGLSEQLGGACSMQPGMGMNFRLHIANPQLQ